MPLVPRPVTIDPGPVVTAIAFEELVEGRKTGFSWRSDTALATS